MSLLSKSCFPICHLRSCQVPGPRLARLQNVTSRVFMFNDNTVLNATAALALSAAVAFSSPGAAVAGLNKMGNSQDAYAAMMAEMEAQRKAEGIKSLSVDSMYEEQGGACGEGYELVTVKVLGASCVCVSDSCKDGAKPEGAREVRTGAERSFGKAKTEDAAPAGDSGIKFVFTPKE